LFWGENRQNHIVKTHEKMTMSATSFSSAMDSNLPEIGTQS